jgi:hypothetical protein
MRKYRERRTNLTNAVNDATNDGTDGRTAEANMKS